MTGFIMGERGYLQQYIWKLREYVGFWMTFREKQGGEEKE